MSRRANRDRSGKARRARTRQRAALVLARQSIEEYLDSDSPQGASRNGPEPVVGRYQFHPTASFVERSDLRKPDQFEFAYEATSATRAVSCPSAARGKGRIRSRFSMARFLFGLLIGGAAASVILLLVQWGAG
ncbi:MAG: hypothetical protein J5J06_17510 [Phycisphaerae bacterium]|nr:hypothetical protein [Phycisphaerae bacterium]